MISRREVEDLIQENQSLKMELEETRSMDSRQPLYSRRRLEANSTQSGLSREVSRIDRTEYLIKDLLELVDGEDALKDLLLNR